MQKGFAPVILILVISGLILAGGFWAYQNNFQNIRQINSYEDCIEAFHPGIEIYLYECSTPDGQHFTRELSFEEQEKLDKDFDNLNSIQNGVESWRTVENKKLGYKIKLPPGWTIRDEDGSGKLYMLSQVDGKGELELQGEITINPAPGQSEEDYLNNASGGIEPGVKYKVIDINGNLAYLDDSGTGIHGSSYLLIKHKEKFLTASLYDSKYSEVEPVLSTLEFIDN